MPANEVFLTTQEILEYLHVNLRTIYRLIKARKIPAVRVGRQWRFRKGDIDAWLETQRPEAAPSLKLPIPSNVRKRVLVVDDEENIRELLAKTLALVEYEVETSNDASSALDRMRRMPYDLLIADLKMAGMDGLTLIKQARNLKANLSIIIITGFSSESSAIDAVNLGVSGYLTKPFRVPQVLEAVARALGR